MINVRILRVLVVLNLLLNPAIMALYSKTSKLKQHGCIETNCIDSRKVDPAPKLTSSEAIVKDAVKNIKSSLNNPDGKLSSICCTYKFSGIKVISKETKKYYNNYRRKPNYKKKCYLNEDCFHPDKIVQVKFNKHSERILVTYKDPKDKRKSVYTESIDATQFELV